MENIKNKAKDHKYLQKAERIYQRLAEVPISQGLPLESTRAGKLSLKACVFEQTIFLRVKELAGVAIKLFRENKLVSAAIITRSLLETVALYNSLYRYLEDAVTTRKIKRTAQMLLRTSLGWMNNYLIRSVNVEKHIKRLQKRFNYGSSAYRDLSEIAHPNWMGCEGAFSKLSMQKNCIKFSEGYEHVPQDTGLPALNGALAIFEHCHNEMVDVLSKFTELCNETYK